MQEKSVTQLLRQWRELGQPGFDALVERTYPELRRIAAARLRGEKHRSLESAGLVNELYLRLVEEPDIDWESRRHFYAVAATVMRRILVEQARARLRQKRKGIRVSIREDALVSPGFDIDVLALDRALERFELAGYEREAQVVQLRFFAGLTIDETARHLGVSSSTVRANWTLAKSWLRRELGRAADERGSASTNEP